MSPSLPIPEELQHLLEKRDTSQSETAERRQKQSKAAEERRSGKDRRKSSRSDEATGESS